MSEVKLVSIGSLKKGNYVIIDGVACVVFDIQVSRPGKHGHAKIRMTGTGILDGNKRVVVKPGHDPIEVPIINKKTGQVLSVNGNMANLMDMETFETFDAEIPSDLADSISEGVNVLFWEVLDDKIIKQVKSE